MGKGGGDSTTTVKNELSPEQRKIMTNVMGKYMPNDQIEDRPNYTQDQAIDRGSQYVSGFNQDQQRAFQETRDNAFQHRPAMMDAAQLAQQGAQPTGTKIGLGQGWSTNNGVSTFEDFSGDAVTRRMNPFQQQVTDRTIADSEIGRQKQRMADSEAAAKGGGWGSRAAIREGVTNSNYDQNLSRTLGQLNTANFNQAQQQYNTDRTVGQGNIDFNNNVDNTNATRASSGAANIANIAGQTQQLDGKGIDAIGKVGDALYNHDQQVLDAGYGDLTNEHNYGLQVGQAISGFAPPPTTTQTTSTSGGGSGIWGAALGGLFQALPMMFSDERIKDDRKESKDDFLAQIRKMKPNQEWSYKPEAQEEFGLPEGKRVGPMAQDYAKATGQEMPEAAEGVGGIDMQDMLARIMGAVKQLDDRTRNLKKAA